MDQHFVKRIFRESYIKEINQKLTSLGNDNKMDTATFCNLRILSTIFAFIMVIYIFDSGYIYAPFVGVGSYYLFYYILIYRKIQLRTSKLDYQALQFFEILTLTLASGRNLEQSLKVTCDNVNSELADEFKKALFEMNFGKTLIEGLEDMKKRIPSETINNIILNIMQTSQFGNSILDTMQNQVDFLREKQILEVKEKINKIPNKVSIVSVIFIVPLIMVLILGPYLIEILS